MAQLDRFLNLLVTNNGSALVLSEGEIAAVVIKDSPRPVMKQALTSAQILTLVREIAPANHPHPLDAKSGVTFEYASADGAFEVSLTQNGKIAARIAPKTASTTRTGTAAQAPALATPAVAQAAQQVEAPRAAAPAPAAARATSGSNRSLERIETLLRTLVGNKASDLHLRAGSPPMLRASGESSPIPNDVVLSSGEIEAMVEAVMLEHNRVEFKEINDSNFAHEIPGLAR